MTDRYWSHWHPSLDVHYTDRDNGWSGHLYIGDSGHCRPERQRPHSRYYGACGLLGHRYSTRNYFLFRDRYTTLNYSRYRPTYDHGYVVTEYGIRPYTYSYDGYDALSPVDCYSHASIGYSWYRPRHTFYDYDTVVRSGRTLYVDDDVDYYDEPTSSVTIRSADPGFSPHVVDSYQDEYEDDVRFKPFVEAGNDSFCRGDYDEARRLYIRAVLHDDRDGINVLLYGLSSFAMGEYDVASDAIRRAMGLDPTLVASPLDVRSMYCDESDFLDHLASLEDRLLSDLSDPDGLLLLGYIYYSMEQPIDSFPIFEHLVETAPHDLLAGRLMNASEEMLPEVAP